MYQTLGIIVIGIAIAALLFTFIFVFNSKKINLKRFSLLNEFPSEVYQNTKNKKVAVISYILFFAATFTLMVLLPLRVKELEIEVSIQFLAGFVLVLFMLGVLGMAVQVVVVPNYVKIHTMIFLASQLLLFLASLVFGFESFSIYKVLEESKYLVLSIISFAMALAYLTALFNPKLATWTKMEQKKMTSDEIVYVRPKVIVLALYEWINYLLVIVNIIVFGLFIIL